MITARSDSWSWSGLNTAFMLLVVIVVRLIKYLIIRLLLLRFCTFLKPLQITLASLTVYRRLRRIETWIFCKSMLWGAWLLIFIIRILFLVKHGAHLVLLLLMVRLRMAFMLVLKRWRSMFWFVDFLKETWWVVLLLRSKQKKYL